MQMGSSKGHHFIRLSHAGGELIFIATRGPHHSDEAIWILTAMAVAMCAILGLASFYIRRILKPLHALKAGVDEVGAGRLSHRIPETGHGELRDLAQAFNAMAERLNRLLHSKEQLLLDVSHELRSPITRLKVQLEFFEDADARESLRSDLSEMEAMVAALLESARLRHTAAALSLKSVSMVDLIRSLIPKFKDRLEIVVEDRGEGIPASALPHLFEPFYRPDISRSRKTGGYGLGLSLCKAIVDAHGGSIDLVSTPG